MPRGRSVAVDAGECRSREAEDLACLVLVTAPAVEWVRIIFAMTFFRPFTQEDNLTSGTGLGLPLVKKIVRTLRGSIHVISKVDKGTSVCVRIPMARSVPGTSIVARLQSQAADLFTKEAENLKSLRVILVGFPWRRR